MSRDSFLYKNKGTLIAIAFVVLLFIPQTGMPIRAFFHKIFSFSPSEISENERETVTDYNWDLITLDSESANLSASKGKVVLINFWATWCPPCVAEMPSLQNLYNEYGDQVDFYFVSAEETAKLNGFMKQNEYDFPVYLQRFSEPLAIKTTSLPTTYVISKSGKIVMKKTGAAEWDSAAVKKTLDRLLQE